MSFPPEWESFLILLQAGNTMENGINAGKQKSSLVQLDVY